MDAITSRSSAPAISRLLSGAVLFQLATGVLLWAPFFSIPLSSFSLTLAYSHAVTGAVLLLVLAIIVRRLWPAADMAFKDFAPAFFPSFFFNQPRWISWGILFSFLLLIASGVIMLPGRWVPGPFLAVAIYLHGTGFLILVPLLISSRFISIVNIKKNPHTIQEDDDWPNPSLEGKYRLSNLSMGNPKNRGSLFVEAYGKMLKYSKLPLLLENYPSREGNFSAGIETAHSGKAFHNTSTPGEALSFLYRRYFKPSAWFPGGASEKAAVSDADLLHFAGLCYSYQACARRGDAGDLTSNEALMAKFGRFILAETGIIPTESYGKQLEKELQSGNESPIPVFIEKQGAEVMFVPAVHDYSGQSDTLRGMITLLHASGTNWTLSREFFDGMNYGAFFGSWFVDSILKKITAAAGNLNVKRIIIGGCGGVAYKDETKGIISANDWVLEILEQAKVVFNIEKFSAEIIGFSGFCDSGCYLSEKSTAFLICQKIFGEIKTVGISGNLRPNSGNDILKILEEKQITVLITPFHNSRERIKTLIKLRGLSIKVYGLYELLGILVKRERHS